MAGGVSVGADVDGATMLGPVVAGSDVDGAMVAGGAAVVGGEAGAGAVYAGRRRVQPGSIQCGSVRVAPPGWDRPSFSW